MNTKAEPKSSRTKRRIFLFGTFVLLVLAGILLAIPMTPWGLSRLTPALESRFSDHLDLDVRIQGLALHWPLAASVDAFSATDATGELRLGVRKARVRISLRQLLRKHILIHRLEADEILFAGLPGPETETEAKTWEFPLQLPDLEGLFDLVELRHLDIKRLVLPPPLLPEPHVFSLKGQWRARELSLDSTWISRGEHPFAEKPHMRITLRLNAFNVEHIRNLVLEMQAGSFAKLIPDWPEDLPDTMEMQLTLCETRHKKVEVLTGQLRTAPVQIDVDGELSLETGMLKLAARAAIPDLSRLQAWCPVPLAGTLQTGLTLTGRIEDPEMTATLLSDAVQLAGYDFRVHHIRHRGKLLPLARRGHLEAFIEYQDLPVRLETGFSFENGNLGLTEFSLATDGFDLATNLSAQFAPLAVQGRIMATASDFSPMGKLFGRDLTGDARLQADLSVEDGVQSVVLNEWAVNWDGLEIIAESPLLIVMEPDRFRFSPWTLRVGRGRLLAEGSMEGKRPKLKVEILDLPLDRFGFAGRMDPGTELNGQFTLSGTLLDPDATLQLDLRGLRPEDPELWDGPPARFRVDLALLEKRLQGAFRLENLPGEPVTLDLDIPAPLSLAPFSFQWPPEGPVEARFSANTDLAGLGRLFVLDVYHRLVGTLAANVHLTGTFDSPRLEGSIRLKQGRYEHELSGTILSDIVLEVAAEREFLSLLKFSASDGAAGTVQASGRMHFLPAERYPFETTLTLNRFRLMKNDQAEAIGRGSLNWDGNLDESRLSGQVQVTPMTLNIPETLPPRLYALDVVEVHTDENETDRAPHRGQTPEAQRQTRRHRVAFDLRIDAPDRLFVRGRGLDSEWSARIQVQGQTPEPLLTGSLNLMRGRFSFFGKRLALQRGIVTFDGAFPPLPLLDVEATLRAGGIIAILRVQGLATDPEIVLDSSPPLPEDEILAQILFGREAARITPWQAITLAQAINKLRGGGSAFDLMGETRRVLRVDQIDVRTPDDEQTGTTVTVGKYISDRVYVELERNVAEESGRAAVEVEITPSLRLETQTGGNADSGIGIIWTRDY